MPDEPRQPPIGLPLTDAQLRAAMEAGARYAVEQARDQIEARTRRVRMQMAEEARAKGADLPTATVLPFQRPHSEPVRRIPPVTVLHPADKLLLVVLALLASAMLLP